MQLASEREIQSAYSAVQTAQEYVARRFESPLMEILHERQVGAVNRAMREARPRRALEVAPGPGRLTRQVQPAGELVCLEFNEGMIAEGRLACAAGVEWVRGNAFELPFGQEFDFLYTFRFVRHFKRPDRERLYEQFRRVVRPGGRLMFDAVNAVVSAPLRAADPAGYTIYDKLYRDEAELGAELTENGFHVERLEPVQRAFRQQYQTQVLVGPRSTQLCRWMIRGMERLSWGQGLEWIVTCRRA
jgi:ubiquinone/menaquinone biosynthesis C-methylase UbiE